MLLSLALDPGTTSIAAIAVDPDGHVVSSVQRANTATLPDLPSGHAEQDPQRIRDIIVDVLSELARDLPGTPAGLGVTGQMHGVLLTDPNRRPLTGLITWQDRRANEPTTTGPPGDLTPSWLETYLAACPDKDLAQTGCTPAPGYLGVTLATLIGSDSIPTGTSGATFLADWVAAELTDTAIVTDRSNAAASGVSIVRLYAGALIPGLILVGLYLVYVVGRSIIQPSAAPRRSRSGRLCLLLPDGCPRARQSAGFPRRTARTHRRRHTWY